MSYSRNKNLTRYVVIDGERTYFKTAIGRNAYESFAANAGGDAFEISFDVRAREVLQPGQALRYDKSQVDPAHLAVIASVNTGETVCGFYSGLEACAADDIVKMVVIGPVNLPINDTAADIANGAPLKWTSTGLATIAHTDNSGPVICASVTDATVQHTTAGGADLYATTIHGSSFKTA